VCDFEDGIQETGFGCGLKDSEEDFDRFEIVSGADHTVSTGKISL
jgi:hypothetical protein